MLDKLTKEQEALIPIVRDEWLFRALKNNGTLNREACGKLIDFMYSLCEIKSPIKVFVDSPLAAQFAINMLRSQIRDQIRDQVWDQVRSQQHEPPACKGLGSDSGWMAFYDFFQKIEVEVGDKFSEYNRLMKTGGFWDAICFEGVCIAFPAPSTVRRDADNRLHSDQEASVEWLDGYKQHYLRGVCFDEETWRKIIDQAFRIEDLFKIENADKRAVAVSMLSPKLLLKHVNAEFVSEGVKGTKLYKVADFMDTGSTEYCMTMECPSTGRMFLEWVDPEVGSKGDADLAQASAWIDEKGSTLSIEDYLTMQEA